MTKFFLRIKNVSEYKRNQGERWIKRKDKIFCHKNIIEYFIPTSISVTENETKYSDSSSIDIIINVNYEN